MDLQESTIKPANHIKGDARTFDFSKYSIEKLFIEKLSTVCDANLPDFERLV